MVGLLQTMLEAIHKDASLYDNKAYLDLLETAAVEFYNFVNRFNGGNTRGYNLRRVGKTLEAIFSTCNQIARGRKDVDWQMLLWDVRTITEIVKYEMEHNLLELDAEYLRPTTDHMGIKRVYKQMPNNPRE